MCFVVVIFPSQSHVGLCSRSKTGQKSVSWVKGLSGLLSRAFTLHPHPSYVASWRAPPALWVPAWPPGCPTSVFPHACHVPSPVPAVPFASMSLCHPPSCPCSPQKLLPTRRSVPACPVHHGAGVSPQGPGADAGKSSLQSPVSDCNTRCYLSWHPPAEL